MDMEMEIEKHLEGLPLSDKRKESVLTFIGYQIEMTAWDEKIESFMQLAGVKVYELGIRCCYEHKQGLTEYRDTLLKTKGDKWIEQNGKRKLWKKFINKYHVEIARG